MAKTLKKKTAKIQSWGARFIESLLFSLLNLIYPRAPHTAPPYVPFNTASVEGFRRPAPFQKLQSRHGV